MRNIITGNSVEEKFASINATLWRMRNKSWKNIFAAVPPVPYSQYRESVGVGEMLFAYMFPIVGKIGKLYFTLDDSAVKSVTLILTLLSKTTKVEKSYVLLAGSSSTIIDLDVTIFDRLVCTLFSAEPTVRNTQITTVQNIWTSLMCEVEIPKVAIPTEIEDIE